MLTLPAPRQIHARLFVGSVAALALAGCSPPPGPAPRGAPAAAHAAPLLSPAFVGSIMLIMLISAFNSVFMIASMTVLQMQVPGELRGRVMGIHSITWSLIAVGGLFVGLLAEAVNARFAVAVSAAILVSVVLLVATADRTVRGLRVT